MPVSVEVARIQAYLLESARRNLIPVLLPPFSLFFHPTDSLKYFNYAIPEADFPQDAPDAALLGPLFARLRAEFRSRGRVARFEFFEAFAPWLPAVLRANGFAEEDRQWNMLCTPGTFQPAPEVAGLEIIALHPDSAEQDVRDYIQTQRQGFDPNNLELPSEKDIQQMREDWRERGWQAFLGRVNGEAASAGAFGRPIEGITEVAGIATLTPFRRRGIAARLTGEAVRAAFDQGVQTACLTAADQNAGRVYERVGFQPFSTMLAYIDEETV